MRVTVKVIGFDLNWTVVRGGCGSFSRTTLLLIHLFALSVLVHLLSPSFLLVFVERCNVSLRLASVSPLWMRDRLGGLAIKSPASVFTNVEGFALRLTSYTF